MTDEEKKFHEQPVELLALIGILIVLLILAIVMSICAIVASVWKKLKALCKKAKSIRFNRCLFRGHVMTNWLMVNQDTAHYRYCIHCHKNEIKPVK